MHSMARPWALQTRRGTLCCAMAGFRIRKQGVQGLEGKQAVLS